MCRLLLPVCGASLMLYFYSGRYKQGGEIMTKGRTVAEKIKCLKCGSLKSASQFYVNTHPLFSTDKLETCKECINSYIGEKGSHGYQDRVRLVLSLMNKPFLSDLWTSRDEDWSRYIPQLSSFPQYKGLTFADSQFSASIENNKNVTHTVINIEQTVMSADEFKELQNFWGRGKNFEADDYIYLQNEFERLLNSYECDSYAMELLFQEAAQQRLTIKKLREEGKPVDKELKTLQDLLGSANVKPVQETGANSVEQATFGTLIKKYENERPIPDPDTSWADVDGIKKYMNIWFFGHLAKMIGIKNDQSELYDQEINAYKVEAPEYQDEEGAS